MKTDVRSGGAVPEEHSDFMAGQDPLDVAAAGWLVRRQDGLAPEEEVEFQAWLAASPEHGEALAQLETVWGELDAVPEDEVDKLREGLREAGPAGLPPRSAAGVARAPRQGAGGPIQGSAAERGGRAPRGFFWRGVRACLPRLALACAVLLAVGAGWLGWQARDGRLLYRTALATQPGEQQTIELPDGSRLQLDTATRVQVALYERRREVVLAEGQAYFVVRPETGRPFDVKAADVRVRVTGTRFGVRATGTGLEAGKVGVAVEQGSVRVRRDGLWPQWLPFGDDGQPLQAGQFVVAGRQEALLPKQAVESDARLAWRERRVSFTGTPLDQALAEFQRYGHGGVVLNGTAGSLRVTGSFDLDRLDAFLLALPEVLPVQVTQSGGRVQIGRK